MNRHDRIEKTLSSGLEPMHLDIVDESHMHNVPAGAESHFNVLIVSQAFEGEKPIARHRRVNSLLRDEFDFGMHALAIHAYTPQEWFDKGGVAAPKSPQCMGGSKATD